MPLIAWAVIDYARNHHKAQSFINMLLSCFQVLGKSAHRLADFFSFD
jgi:hypothetical protein